MRPTVVGSGCVRLGATPDGATDLPIRPRRAGLAPGYRRRALPTGQADAIPLGMRGPEVRARCPQVFPCSTTTSSTISRSRASASSGDTSCAREFPDSPHPSSASVRRPAWREKTVRQPVRRDRRPDRPACLEACRDPKALHPRSAGRQPASFISSRITRRRVVSRGSRLEAMKDRSAALISVW